MVTLALSLPPLPFCLGVSPLFSLSISLPTPGDPFRAGGDTEFRKVLGHGHGRSRRLSLRHYRIGNYVGPGRGGGARPGVGTYGGYASARHGGGGASQRYHNGHSAPNINNRAATTGGVGVGASPSAASAFGGEEDCEEEELGPEPAFSPALASQQQPGSGGQILLELAGDGGGGGGGGGGRHYRVASFGDDEWRWRRRTESLGCYQHAVDPSSPYGLGYREEEIRGGGGGDVRRGGTMARSSTEEAQGSGAGGGGGGGGGGGRGLGVGGGAGLSLSRARSAGFEPSDGEGDLIDEFDFACQDRLAPSVHKHVSCFL